MHPIQKFKVESQPEYKVNAPQYRHGAKPRPKDKAISDFPFLTVEQLNKLKVLENK